MSFSKNFVWGAASAAYQIEGAWTSDGKGASIWDDFCQIEGAVQNGDTGNIACDSYNRYPEDISLMKQMGLHAYRFSINWPRIFPDGHGKINEKGLAHYDAFVDLLLENDIVPYITLFHWDLPSALQKEGGWQNRKTAEAFAKFAAVIAKHFEGRVKHYFTLNEPQCFIALGYATGFHAPGLKLPMGDIPACMHNALLAHGLAVRALRESSSEPLQIGMVSTGQVCYPAQDTPASQEAAKAKTFSLKDDWLFSHNWFLDAAVLGHYPEDTPLFLRKFAASVPDKDWDIIKNDLEFLGVNIYHGEPVDNLGNPVINKHPGYPRTAMKWPVTPEAMHYGCKWLYERYDLPIYIAENGQSCNDRIFLDGKVHDPDRIDFLHRYLRELKKASESGIPILGYFQWSIMDNFEWQSGYDERFGLIYIDYPTLRRIPKDSAYWYAKTIQDNGENL